MIPEIEAEVVNSHHWLNHQEFADANRVGTDHARSGFDHGNFRWLPRRRNGGRSVRYDLRFPAFVLDDDCRRIIVQTIPNEPADAGFSARSCAGSRGSAGRRRLERRTIRNSFDHRPGNGVHHSAGPAPLPAKCLLGPDRRGCVSILVGVGVVVVPSHPNQLV